MKGNVFIVYYACIVFHVFLLISCNVLESPETEVVYKDDMRVPLADPFIWVGDSMYYAYGTNSPDGIMVFSSSNLIEWFDSKQLAIHKDDSFGDNSFWAPDMSYNTKTNKYLLYYAAENHMCVAAGDSPLGPFQQIIKEPMSQLWAVDHTVYKHEDGTLYMYYSTNFNSNYEIWVCRLTEDGLHIEEDSHRLCFRAEDSWECIGWPVVEGPYVIEYKGLYYMIYSGSGYETLDYAVGYAIAENPMGPWYKYEGNPIFKMPQYGNQQLYGTGHGSIFKDLEDNLRFVFHAHNSRASVHPRCMYITSIHFTNDSIPIMYFGEDILEPFWRKGK